MDQKVPLMAPEKDTTSDVPPDYRPPPPLELPILSYMKTHRVILASASPRRKALLARLGLTNIEIVPSTKPENLSKSALGPFEYVSETARRKCLDVYQTIIEKEGGGEDPDLVISADTVIVTREGRILEKPTSEVAHVRMLKHLRDTRVHRVLTAVCCLAPKVDATHPGYEMALHVEESKVFFAKDGDGLQDAIIESYVRTREGVDKAGGYALQGVAGLVLVDRVEGNVDNVIGLPVRKCLQLCEKVIFQQGQEPEEESEED